MAKITTREKALERAVTLRALVIAHLNKSDMFASVSDIYLALKSKLDESKVTEKILASQLKRMADNNLITVKREGTRNYYSNDLC